MSNNKCEAGTLNCSGKLVLHHANPKRPVTEFLELAVTTDTNVYLLIHRVCTLPSIEN